MSLIKYGEVLQNKSVPGPSPDSILVGMDKPTTDSSATSGSLTLIFVVFGQALLVLLGILGTLTASHDPRPQLPRQMPTILGLAVPRVCLSPISSFAIEGLLV